MFTALNYVYFSINGRHEAVGYRVLEQGTGNERVMFFKEAEEEYRKLNLYDTIGHAPSVENIKIHERTFPPKDIVLAIDQNVVIHPKKLSNFLAARPTLHRLGFTLRHLDLTLVENDLMAVLETGERVEVNALHMFDSILREGQRVTIEEIAGDEAMVALSKKHQVKVHVRALSHLDHNVFEKIVDEGFMVFEDVSNGIENATTQL